VILPFEKEFYAKHSMEVEYKGNPLLDEIHDYSLNADKQAFLDKYDLGKKPIIALLPGSRTQEIKKMLPIQLSLVDKYPEFDFIIAGVNTHSENFYKNFIGEKNNVRLIYNQTYSILNNAHAAVVTSGTATLETALFNVPEVVCYKANALSFLAAKYLVKIEYISLVNIILKEKAVVELLQDNWKEDCLEKEFKKICFDENYREQMQYLFNKLKNLLGDSGASASIAQSIIEHVNKQK
jgi:lipid-A-disaccharide synthase